MTSVIFGSFLSISDLCFCVKSWKGLPPEVRDLRLFPPDRNPSMPGFVTDHGTIFEILRQLRSVSWSLTQGATCNLVQSVILGQIEYCNVALAGLPQRNIFWLQVVINAAADLILQFYESNPISTRIQDELQWLRKGKCIQHLCILVHKCLNNCITPLWQAASGCYQMTQ